MTTEKQREAARRNLAKAREAQAALKAEREGIPRQGQAADGAAWVQGRKKSDRGAGNDPGR